MKVRMNRMSNGLRVFDEFGVTEKNGQPIVSSRKVAEIFNKRHDHVLRDIREMRCSEGFRLLNFGESSYKNEQNKKQPEILMTKDGFTLLAMGFTGKKAMEFKEAYIKRFNDMEIFIKNLFEAKAEFPEFTDAIMAIHTEPKHYHFSNEVNMINTIVLGMTAKKFKELNGLGDVPSIRPYLTNDQIDSIRKLQRIDIGLCYANKTYEERKLTLSNLYQSAKQKRLAAK